MYKLLIVDDEPSVVEMFAEIFNLNGFEIQGAGNVEQALEKAGFFKPDIVFLDMDLVGDGLDRSGKEVLIRLREKFPSQELPIIVISGVGNTQLLSEVKKLGADDYEVKPVNFENLLKKAVRLIERAPASTFTPQTWEEGLIGESKVIMNLANQVLEYAKQESDMLILGETGTGKDTLAKFYHKNSPRARKPLQIIDCTRLSSPELFESAVFGHVKGSFTSAIADKPGQIEAGQDGVVFFNEIGDVPPLVQPKLLQVMEKKTYSRVGSNEIKTSNAIFLAATLRDLSGMMQAGTFRDDLYFRVWKNIVVCPPLRDRLNDLPILVDYFIRKANLRFHKHIQGADDRLLAELRLQKWPGNIRDLEHIIEDGAQKCIDQTLTWEDVQGSFNLSLQSLNTSLADPALPRAELELKYPDFEKWMEERDTKLYQQYLRHHLKKYKTKTQTARELGIEREKLNYLIKQYDV